MSSHWKLAVRYAIWTVAVASLICAAVGFYYGASYAGAMFYGVAVGLVSFVSTALSVSLITGPSDLSRALGAASFFLRYGFVAVALGIPAYLGLWPIVAMMAGFGGVYLAENVVLLPGAFRVLSGSSGTKKQEPNSENEEVERRVKV